MLSRGERLGLDGVARAPPVGYLVAGPLAALLGARVVLAAGGDLGIGFMALALVPRATRELTSPLPGEPPASAIAEAAA